MKRFIALLLAALMLCVGLSGCGSSEDQRVVYVCNWGEYLDESLNDEFTAKTGIKVVYDYFDTNESLYATLKNGSAKYDVVVPSDYMIEKMINEDMLAEIDFSLIPNYKNIDPKFKDLPFDPENKYSVPYIWGVLGIIYNTEMVTEAPDSWDVFWDEQYAGNILMIGNQRDAMAVALKTLGFSLNTTDETEILGAENMLVKQKDILQAYVMDQAYNKMESNSAAICCYYAGDAMVMMENNPSLAFALPEEGTNYYVDSFVIPKISENQDEAAEYINFMLEAESGKRNTEMIYASTPNMLAQELLSDDIKNNPALYPSEEYLDKCEMYTALPDDIYAMYNTIWTNLGQ